MSRTFMDFTMTDKRPEEVRNFLGWWFSQAGFEVRTWCSDGAPMVHGIITSRLRLAPRPGAIVAVSYKMSGAVVFEISLIAVNQGTLMHGEFYAAGAGPMFGKELDLSPNPPLLGKFPRKRGYKAVGEFLRALQSFSEQPPGSR